jgi:cell division protein FtsL
MNTTVAVLGARKNLVRSRHQAVKTRFLLLPAFIFIVLTLFSIIYFKDCNRRLFLESQGLTHQLEVSKVQQGQLMLEQSTLTAQSRVQRIAQSKFDMTLPSVKNTVILSL